MTDSWPWASAQYHPEVLRKAKIVAALEGVSRAEILRRALNEFLASESKVLSKIDKLDTIVRGTRI